MKSLKSIRKRKAFTTANEQFDKLKKLRGTLKKAKDHYKTELNAYRAADRRLNDAYAGGDTSEISELRELRDKAKKKLNDRQQMIENTGSKIDQLEAAFNESFSEVKGILSDAINNRVEALQKPVQEVESLSAELMQLQKLGVFSNARKAVKNVPSVLAPSIRNPKIGNYTINTNKLVPNRNMSKRLKRTAEKWNSNTKNQ